MAGRELKGLVIRGGPGTREGGREGHLRMRYAQAKEAGRGPPRIQLEVKAILALTVRRSHALAAAASLAVSLPKGPQTCPRRMSRPRRSTAVLPRRRMTSLPGSSRNSAPRRTPTVSSALPRSHPCSPPGPVLPHILPCRDRTTRGPRLRKPSVPASPVG